MAAFTDAGVALADLEMQGAEAEASLAMVTEERIREATMAVRESKRGERSWWMMWAFWAAGVSLLLVELNAGMAYVDAGLQQNLTNLMGWAPALGMMTLRVAEQSLWHWETIGSVLRAVPLGALGFLLVGLGLALNREIGNSKSAKP